jgi:hypothetical protein
MLCAIREQHPARKIETLLYWIILASSQDSALRANSGGS